MSKNLVRENVPLSRFGVLVAQLESIGASASQQSPDPLLSFDLLSAIDEEPQESILLWQRKCEDALYSLLKLGSRRPIISRGDSISIYSRASSLQGFLSDAKRSEPQRVAGAVRCLGELYQHFGRKITSGLPETTIIASKLMKFHKDFVRQEALLMLEKALEGSGGSAASTAYTEAFRLITLRIAGARCLKVFASIGGPCLGVGELRIQLLIALEDPVLLVMDAFSEALGSLLALGMNPEAQVQPRGKGPFPPAKKLEGGLQRHLALPFTKSGTRLKDVRIGITLSWVYFLQAIRLKYLHPDSELQQYALQVMEMLRPDTCVDAHALACILYILRVGVTDQMTEPTQRGFLVFLGKQLESSDVTPSMKIAALCTLSYTLKTLGEVPDAVETGVWIVRIEAALALRVLAEVDPTCVGGLISYVVTTLSASRDNVSFEKGSNLNIELDSLNGQTTVLAALVSISPKLPLGYPARLPRSVLELSKKMLTESSRNPVAAIVEKEAEWSLLSSLLSSMPKQELEDQVFDILWLWATLFSGNPEREIQKIEDLASRICVWSAAVDALTSFVRCFISPNAANNGILLQPVMVYLSSALSYILLLQRKELPNIKPAIDIFIIRTLMAYRALPDSMAYKSDHTQSIQLCTFPMRDAARCEESSCLRLLLDKGDAWLGPWIPGRDWFEDEVCAFQGGKDGLMPCAWDNEPSSFPLPETINKMLVNQMLLCFGIMFASQALIALRPQPLGPGILHGAQAIFQSVMAEISSWQETATLLESVRFTHQLVLSAPQVVSVHTHVQTLLSTLSSGQPTLRHLAVSTLRHLIEKDPVSISDEQIEDSLFHMLNEETDSVIGSLVQATIMRLLLASCPSCPSHWILICRNMVLAKLGRQDTDTNRSAGNDPSNGPDNDSGMDLGEDDENMVSGSKGMPMQGSAFGAHRINHNRDKNLRYRTRVFAAECLSHLPIAVGKNPAHFDLSLARKQYTNGGLSRDWLVLHVQELISLAYQISTIQFENMRPIGVGLLTAILDKIEKSPDPELPGHLLLEQYQARLVSAVRTALDASSGPILLEAGLQLATKIRLLAAHASLKCYTFSFLRRHHSGVPDEYLALLPLFSKSSSIMRKYWIGVLKDYSYICLCLDAKKNWNPFLDGIQSPLVSSKVQLSLEESWPVILQALALDAIPVNTHGDSKATDENTSNNSLISGYSMVELELEDYRFLWGFSLLVLFQRKHPALTRRIILSSAEVRYSGDSPTEETNTAALKQYEIIFTEEYITMDICRELLQVFFYSIYMDNSWNTLSISVLSQIVQNCPADFLEAEALGYLAMELLLAYIFSVFQRTDEALSDHLHCEELISPLFIAAKTLVKRCEPKKQLKSVVVALVLVAYKCIREAMTELSFSTVNDFVKCTTPLMKNLIDDSAEQGNYGSHLRAILGTCLNVIADLIKDCIKGIHLLENKRPDLLKLLQLKLSFSIEQMVLFAKLVYESQYCRQTEDSNTICLAVLKYCTKYIQTVLNDSNVQVQAIGLQVLKTMTQRSANIEDISFFTFFSGELITEIFHIIRNSLKKPASKESVAIAGECLRFLVLLQTLSKANECQRGFMNLLLKAIVMIFSASEDDSSQEVSDIRTNAVRLVSSLAQILSSAVCLKDVLLSMPVSHKQQHQGVIRASVAQHQNASPMKTMASLEIKLPVPKDSQTSSTSTLPIDGSRQKSSPPSSPVHFDQDSMEDDQEDEDDWDAFQSFPVSTDAAGTVSKAESAVEKPDLVEKGSFKTFLLPNPSTVKVIFPL
ncbi:HEAT repeat-containing protein [Salix suchowensis]|nr:HEAT repeat-containing protein [Salix suchowensis]